jgi:hypothetical protein
MNDSWLWIALAVGELLFVVVLLLLVSWLRNRAARLRDRRAIRSLVAETKKLKDQRREQIATFLTERFGLSGEMLARAVRGVYRAELHLIQTFANIYLHRDARAAAGFRQSVEEGVEPYWELAPGEATAAPESAEVAEEDEDVSMDAGVMAEEESGEDPELARLRGENVRLSEELRVTMDTMSRMLNEYSTIFSKDSALSDITVLDAAGEGVASDAAVDTDLQASGVAEDVAGESDNGAETEPVGMTPSDATAAEATLDAAMKDLSVDDEQPRAEQTPEEERQRIIDAES